MQRLGFVATEAAKIRKTLNMPPLHTVGIWCKVYHYFLKVAEHWILHSLWPRHGLLSQGHVCVTLLTLFPSVLANLHWRQACPWGKSVSHLLPLPEVELGCHGNAILVLLPHVVIEITDLAPAACSPDQQAVSTYLHTPTDNRHYMSIYFYCRNFTMDYVYTVPYYH